jgi:PX domain
MLTTVNKEGVEFAETRKKDLAKFLKKCMRHNFLKSTSELSVFLYDDQGFINFKKREESINDRKIDNNLFEKIMSLVNTTVRGNNLPLKELDETENQIYNYEVNLVNLSKRLNMFAESMLKIIELKRTHVSNSISFVSSLQELCRSLYL